MRMRHTGLENITSSGGLLSEYFISLMREDSISFPFVASKTFKLPWSKADESLGKREYDRRVSQVWNELMERWDLYGYGKLQKMSPEEARSRWTGPLLEALGFELVSTPKHIEISDTLKFRFSHRGWIASPDNGKPPVVHIVPPTQDLDQRLEKGLPSPHDALQAFLNVHEDKWGLVTNGLYLRLLRDYYHTYTKGYVEFDLEAIFLTRSFSDFQALYRLVHASRFMLSDSGEVYLEEYFKHSQSVGEKIGKDLRQNVLQAITTLGNGFLDAELLSELKSDQTKCYSFYEEILKIVYRIIFLLYAEQRGMLGGAGEHNLYLEEYSLTALRERAASYGKVDGHKDRWIGLKNTFRIIWKGSPALGIYPYNGMLFETSGEEYISRYDCKNEKLLEAIRFLTLTEIEGTARRISYSDINVEEIGAIYESLLDYTPRVIEQPEEIEGVSYFANSFILDPRGSARKTSGSYYTNKDLVQELIKSALEPVIAERLRTAGQDKAAREKAILSIKVCDTATGSGAFLIAACNRLGLELARVRMEPVVPDIDAIQEAKRDVLQACIYGVDLNPWAVELAKVSLWINAMVKDKPLNFLDHHIKCGNSLIGATPELIAQGVPDGAFDAITGDDKKVAKHFKEINKKQRKVKGATLDRWEEKAQLGYTEDFARLSTMEEDSAKGVVDKCKEYHRIKDAEDLRRKKLEADAWTAAFFVPLNDMRTQVPTSGEVKRLGMAASLDDPMAKSVEEIADRYKFFHWFLEFPEVFAVGGFDVILGNPPWERIKLQEKEFFAAKDPEVAGAPTASARKILIQKLKETRPELAKEYVEALRHSESESKFIRNSERVPLTGAGDVNTYAVFAELVQALVREDGRSGIVVPSGIATDFTYKDFFAHLIDEGRLAALYDFENREGLFQGTHRSYKFSLLTTTGGGISSVEFAFFLHNVRDLQDPERRITLSKEDLASINPNTRTCPVFRTRRDAELTRKLYKSAPVLVNEQTGDNPWGVSFLRMFDMTNDSHLFRTREELEADEFALEGNHLVRSDEENLPVYEGRMIHFFDHRPVSVGVSTENQFRSGVSIDTTLEEYTDPNFTSLPRYWIKSHLVKNAISEKAHHWFIAFKDITSPTNERTLIATAIPFAAVGNSAPLLMVDECLSPRLIVAFMGNLASFVLDFAARQKLGSVHVNFFLIQQFPIFPPDRYTPDIIEMIAPKVIELTYTAWDIKAFADDLWREAEGPLRAALKRQWDENVAETDGGHSGAEPPSWAEISPDGFPYSPFKWHEERRARLRAELDAIYAHLYGVTREELEYILETFPIIKRKDIERYGSYRTKEMILRYYDEYAGKIVHQ